MILTITYTLNLNESLWGSVKIHWISVNIEPLNFSDSIFTEIQLILLNLRESHWFKFRVQDMISTAICLIPNQPINICLCWRYPKPSEISFSVPQWKTLHGRRNLLPRGISVGLDQSAHIVGKKLRNWLYTREERKLSIKKKGLLKRGSETFQSSSWE